MVHVSPIANHHARGAQRITCPQAGCDHALTAYGAGTITHHDDGSHTFEYAQRRELLVVDSHIVTIPIDDGAQRILECFIRDHEAKLNAALIDHGLTISDIAVPIFERLVWRDELGD